MCRKTLRSLAPLLLLAAAPADEPRPGLVFERRMNGTGTPFVAGWQHLGGGYWGDANKDECCFDVFRSGRSSILALVEPVDRDPRGGMLSSRILKTHRMTLKPGEDWAGCSFEGRGGAARGAEPDDGPGEGRVRERARHRSRGMAEPGRDARGNHLLRGRRLKLRPSREAAAESSFSAVRAGRGRRRGRGG
jgi:hypothetical protein